ncbi:MAG: DUF3332 domain-containing protein [Duncaniella sp.]|uniref:DUF3332 domain-containing protein n=1 Tax=Duncaniella sp. TaxID=2518496 RepID=UPI0023C83367|nr:DUF3332 domain-containing protein [Duncaniella sp.]MDE5987935.1 DUF3332 domain-containing protein [Duncaniella sp.]
MKKRYLPVAIAIALTGSMLSTSCIGSFALTNKLLSWNKQVGNKFVNELVFFAFWVIPVYEVSCLADVLVLNSIEFWSGDNPVAAGKKVIDGKDGRYIVECDGKGYTITSENDKSVVRLDFDKDDQTWSVAVPGGESYELMTFIDESHVAMPAPDGSRSIVELSDNGLMAYREMVNAGLMAAR